MRGRRASRRTTCSTCWRIWSTSRWWWWRRGERGGALPVAGDNPAVCAREAHGAAEAPAMRQRHAQFFLALAEQAEPQLAGAEQVAWLDRLEQEHDNLRAVLRWFLEHGEAEPGLRLGGALWRFWRTRGHLTEGRAWLVELLALPSAPHPRRSGKRAAGWPAARANALIAAGDLASEQDEYATAQALFAEALALGRELADERGHCQGAGWPGIAGVGTGRRRAGRDTVRGEPDAEPEARGSAPYRRDAEWPGGRGAEPGRRRAGSDASGGEPGAVSRPGRHTWHRRRAP